MRLGLLLFLLLPFSSFCQTKTIFYKRHYIGYTSSKSFLSTIDESNSNFGMAPERWVRNSKLEKVKFLNDSTAVMFTEDECLETFSNHSERWRAGADTVVHHPVFASGIPVDSMRQILKTDFFFANNMDEVEFEGDNQRFETTKTRKPKRARRLPICMIPSSDSDVSSSEDEGSGKRKRRFRNWFLLLFVSSAAAGTLKPR